MKKQIVSILFILVASIFVIKPLFSPGFFPVHDNAQIVRVAQMAKSLSDGMFPVRWVADMGFGYGYPVFNFYAPFAYYLGAFFVVLVHMDVVMATKLMIALSVLMAGIGMYLFSREFWGEEGGVISGLLYLYVPYHAVDLYVRGDIAESWAFAFIPWVLWGLWKAYKSYQWRYVVIGSLSYAGLILSHNLTALMVTPFILLFLIILAVAGKSWKKLLFPLGALLGGLLLSAFYWVPVFPEMKFTDVASQLGGGFDYHQHFVCLSQFWYSPWGFGGSGPGCNDGVSFMLGKIHMVAIGIGIVALILLWKDMKRRIVLISSLSVLFLSLFLTTQASVGIWDSIHVMEYLQFPWRFLVIAAFCMSFIGGVSIFLLPKKVPYAIRLGLLGIISFGIVLLNMKLFMPQTVLSFPTSYFVSREMITWEVSKTANEYMPKSFSRPSSEIKIPRSLIEAHMSTFTKVLTNSTGEKSIRVRSSYPSRIHLNIAYFPAWHAYLDGKPVPVIQVPTGMTIAVPSGEHIIVMKLEQTGVELLADIVSVIGICSLILGILYFIKKGKLKRTHEPKTKS